MEHVEHIASNGKPLVYIIRAEMHSEKTTFLTPEECNLQLGFVVYPQGGGIARYVQQPLHGADGPRIDLFIPQTLCAISQERGGFLYYG
jgi:hypothetical protein